MVSFSGTGQSPTWEEIGFFLAKSSLMAMLIATTIIDIDYRIVPDQISLTGIVLGLLFSAALPSLQDRPVAVADAHSGSFLAAVLGVFVGGASIFVAGVLGKLLFRKESMGMGDVKFMGMVGAFLGWKAALLSFLIACFIGSFFGIAIRIVTKEQYIAFVPYLAGGAVIMLFWGNHVLFFISQYIFHQVPL
jgi:leader peptidase (prepilin peptidase)/N-methyltransferase